MSSNLSHLERGVLLAGERCPSDQREKMEEGRRNLNRDFFAAQSHVNLLFEDSERFFQEAIDRALESLGEQSATVCEQPEGISALMRGPRGGSACPGRDITGQIIGRLADDDQLNQNIRGIMGVPWPSVTVDSVLAPQSPITVTGNSGYVRMSTLSRLIDDEIQQLEARLNLEVQPGLSAEELETLRVNHEDRFSNLGDQLFNAAYSAWSAENLELSICINPTDLGGCSGNDYTERGVLSLQRHGISTE